MFLVHDTREQRTQMIEHLLQSYPGVAVIVAAADFEWTCRRCILALGISPTKEMKSKGATSKEDGVLYKCSGFNGYKSAWNKEVAKQGFESLEKFIDDMDFFTNKAYPLRHKLVHGSSGTTGKQYAEEVVRQFLNISNKLNQYALDNGKEIFGTKIIRRVEKNEKNWGKNNGALR